MTSMDMPYSSEGTKWKAYQFSDPFAAKSFFVCNKINKFFCRPDCDARPITNLKSEIKFVNLVSEAINYGYIACDSCDPLSVPLIDVDLLVDCVASINKQIGFLPPLLDEDEERNNEKIKENIIESKKTNEEQIMQAIGGRRSSVPVINFEGKYSKDFENTSLSKNDFDHYRLVDLACRHLALAAASNIFQPQGAKGSRSVESSPSSSSNSKKRRRRGGVLGFKELAAKSKLSAWHFHRVFKSVTGLTPKTYGDKCWEYIKNYLNSSEYTSNKQAETQQSQLNGYQTPITNSSESASSIPASPNELPSNKRIKLEPAQEVKFEISSPPQNEETLFKDRLVLPNQVPMDTSNSRMSTMNMIPSPMDGDVNINKMNPMKYSVPQQATFDINVNQPITDNNFNMFNENLNNTQDLNQDFSSTTRAFSAPDLSQYNPRPTTLFSHLRSNERTPEESYSSNRSSQSPILNDNIPTIDEIVPANQYMKEPEGAQDVLNDVPELNTLLYDSGVNSLNPLNDEGNLELNLNNNYFDQNQNTFNLGFSSDLLSTNNDNF